MDACREYEGLISAFIDGEITEPERAKLMEHMAACPACQSYFDDQIAIHDALTGLEAQAPADFSEQVMARVRAMPQERPQEEKKRIVFPSWRRWAALAACCALAAGVWAFGPGKLRDTAETSVIQYARDAAGEERPTEEAESAPAEDAGAAAQDSTAGGESGAESSVSPDASDGTDGCETPQSTETETVSAPPPAPADTALPEGALGKVQVQDAGDAGDEAAAEDALSAEPAGEEPAEGQESAQDEVCVQFFQSPPMDGAGAVCRLEEAETVSVTITAWQDEAFTAQVTDPGSCDFLQAGDEVLVWFEAGTEVLLSDGTVFSCDGEAPNAPDCGLEAGTAVAVTFSSYETDPALRLYAVTIQE